MRSVQHDEHLAFRVAHEDAAALRALAAAQDTTVSSILRSAVEILVSEAERPTLDDVASENVFIRRAHPSHR